MGNLILSLIFLISSILGGAVPDDAGRFAAANSGPVFSISAINGAVLERIEGVSWKPGCPVGIDDLRLLSLSYIDFDGNENVGELICHNSVAEDLTEIFRELYEMRFPIGNMRLIDDYGADDLLSMEANNTSSFNYRTVSDSSNLSRHAYGVAVDINPVQNPYTEDGGAYVSPESGREYADRGDVRPGMVTRGGAVYDAFVSRGWFWGGDWKYQIDYQHFQKDVPK